MSVEEIAESGQHTIDDVNAALKAVQSLDPSGVAARDMRECLLIQIENHNGRGGVAWQIVCSHLKLLETRQFKELAKGTGPPRRTHPDRRRHDPAPRSPARPALYQLRRPRR